MEKEIVSGGGPRVEDLEPNTKVIYKGKDRIIFLYERRRGRLFYLVNPQNEEKYKRNAFPCLVSKLADKIKAKSDPLKQDRTLEQEILLDLIVLYGFERLELGELQKVESLPRDPLKVRIHFPNDLVLEVPLNEEIVLPFNH